MANWKMNPQTLKEAKEIFNGIKKAAKKLKKVEIIICPPFVYLSELKIKNKELKIGAQDLFWENPPAGGGAYTGEISPKMLRGLGVDYAIIGHSERRDPPAGGGETNEIVNKKIKAGLAAGLKIILCVGEKERDLENRYFNLVKDQVIEGLRGIPKKYFKNIFIAYEPVWAISSKDGAIADTPESSFRMAIFIRRMLLPVVGNKLARAIPILYGGSVNSENVAGFLQDMQGALVGGKSLSPKDFGEILKIANSIK